MKRLRRLHVVLLALVCFLSTTGCATKHSDYCMLELGDIVTSNGNQGILNISILMDRGNPKLDELGTAENIQSISFPGASGVQVTGFDVSRFDTGRTYGVERLLYNVDYQISEDIVEVTAVEIETAEQTYQYDIGSVTIRRLEQAQDAALSLKSHLATIGGPGLTYFCVSYKNTSDHAVTISKIDRGVLTQFPVQVTINDEWIEDPDHMDYRVEAGATIDIKLEFDINGSVDTQYQIFFLSMRLTVEDGDERYQIAPPSGSNGLDVSNEELKEIFETHR